MPDVELHVYVHLGAAGAAAAGIAAGTTPPACPPRPVRSPREAPRLRLRTARAAPWPGLPTARRGPGHGHGAAEGAADLQRLKFLPSVQAGRKWPGGALRLQHQRSRPGGGRGWPCCSVPACEWTRRVEPVVRIVTPCPRAPRIPLSVSGQSIGFVVPAG